MDLRELWRPIPRRLDPATRERLDAYEALDPDELFEANLSALATVTPGVTRGQLRENPQVRRRLRALVALPRADRYGGALGEMLYDYATTGASPDEREFDEFWDNDYVPWADLVVDGGSSCSATWCLRWSPCTSPGLPRCNRPSRSPRSTSTPCAST